MTNARRDGLTMLIFGSIVFVILGVCLENTIETPSQDYGAVYFPARTLIHQCDPYKVSEVLRINQAEVALRPLYTVKMLGFVKLCIYLPTAFSLTVPFAMLPWGLGHILWMALTVGGLILAAFLIWNPGVEAAPIAAGTLLGFLLATSQLIVIFCNPAGIAVSLCVVAVWCFLRQRFVPLGILCLAVSLALKPHDSGLVWLYFLLAGGVYRKRALQTLLATAALSLPAILWVWRVAPNWMREWQSNVSVFSAHGGINDPGRAASAVHGRAMVISMQSLVGAFWDDPRVFNPAGYLAAALLLFVWVFVTLRSRPSLRKDWLALAAIAALSMLPVCHHLYDTKLLMLTVPACAMLWVEGGWIGWSALTLNVAGFTLTGDLSWAILFGLFNKLHLSEAGFSGQLQTAVRVIPVPLILLIMSVFYLWVYARRCPAIGSLPA
jgi:hypothetical protein